MVVKYKTILIFAYYSFKDPVFQSAVLPYFLHFPQKEKFKFVLLTFEQNKFKLESSERKRIEKELLAHSIVWYPRKWHSGYLKLLKKVYDFISGIILSVYLIKKYKVKAIYSEGFPGAIIGHYISKLTTTKHLVHTYEPHADYMLESGVWSYGSWEYRLLKSLELRVAKNCYCIFTATSLMIDKLRKLGIKAKMFRIPSAIDLNHYSFLSKEREKIRRQLNITKDEVVLVYLGKIGGMYFDNELTTMISTFESKGNVKFRYFIFTPDLEKADEILNKAELESEKYLLKTLKKDEVPEYLSASDWAICGVKPIQSRRFSSPIKNGEYWACGLPLLIMDGISDDYLFAEKHQIGIRIKDTSIDSYTETLIKITKWQSQHNKSMVRDRCIEFVKNDRDINKYKRLYCNIFSGL